MSLAAVVDRAVHCARMDERAGAGARSRSARRGGPRSGAWIADFPREIDYDEGGPGLASRLAGPPGRCPTSRVGSPRSGAQVEEAEAKLRLLRGGPAPRGGGGAACPRQAGGGLARPRSPGPVKQGAPGLFEEELDGPSDEELARARVEQDRATAASPRPGEEAGRPGAESHEQLRRRRRSGGSPSPAQAVRDPKRGREASGTRRPRPSCLLREQKLAEGARAGRSNT